MSLPATDLGALPEGKSMKHLAALVAATALVAVAPAPATAGRACAGYVGLTFDDGPTPGNTATLLDALQRARLRATMFNTGQNVEAHPELAKAQVAAGMWIGNHSWDHPFMTRLPEAGQADQISRTQDTIRRVTGVTPALFRPPYLDTDDALRAVEKRFGLTEINADVDAKDWGDASVDEIVSAVGRLRDGDVILMHDWPPNTVAAIPRIAATLRERGLCAGKISPVTGRAVAPHARALAGVHTVGRLDDRGAGVRYTWPGVYFESRFRGTSVGIVLDDAVNDYEVQIDGRAAATLVTPGRTTHWIRDLAPGVHTVRLAKRTESPWTPGQFGGFAGDLLGAPAARSRQIEFIGDSWTAGYGNMSAGRDCSATGIDRNSNADQAFGALTARTLGADYQLNAWSGRGLVRNYDGSDPGVDYLTYYDRVLQAADEAVWQRPPTWRPQTVVIGLGINDFSTPLHAGERWPDEAALAADFRAAYLDFLKKLRQRYGHRTSFVLTYPSLWNTTALADSVQQVVAQRTADGDRRITALHYDNAALGLDLLGCDWHPSARDHRLLASALTTHLRTLG
ncbi:polysaccharide deacetylase family protein [Actinoplanes xinjiangensis]|uniref:Peptidoglycan/xylan/chitin deacetylase (PgdA/CDA1 family) n=1 Tax=Actinoplanes xinjiangensis TaxID=512350 RepID=A0A316FIH0_9ACTN|nr:polysaccharide deacetylase family protein [Actinoplanes xinjiangensis]PWK47600.1 peptidoglycan/xylan/chitin deacetylase (PgdA/CDA1 family) [Actinoplanes xinjiangensis]